MSILLTEDHLTAKELATLNEWPEERLERLRGEIVNFIRQRIVRDYTPDPVTETDEGPSPCGLPDFGPTFPLKSKIGGTFIPDPVLAREDIQ